MVGPVMTAGLPLSAGSPQAPSSRTQDRTTANSAARGLTEFLHGTQYIAAADLTHQAIVLHDRIAPIG